MPKTRDRTDKPKTRDRNIPGFRLRKPGTTSLPKTRDGTGTDPKLTKTRNRIQKNFKSKLDRKIKFL